MKKIISLIGIVFISLTLISCGPLFEETTLYGLEDVLGFKKEEITAIRYRDLDIDQSLIVVELEEGLNKIDINYTKEELTDEEFNNYEWGKTHYEIHVFDGFLVHILYLNDNGFLTYLDDKTIYTSKTKVDINQQFDLKDNQMLNGTLLFQSAFISSYIKNIDLEIKDGSLFFDDKLLGTIGQKQLIDDIVSYNDSLYNINLEHNQIYEALKANKYGYIIGKELSPNKSNYIIVEALDKYFLLQLGYGTYGSQEEKYIVNHCYYISNYIDVLIENDHGGDVKDDCLFKVKYGSTFKMDFEKVIYLTNEFLDFETLEIYKDEIVVTKDLNLITYHNGVFPKYLKRYLHENTNIKYLFTTFTIEQFPSGYVVLDNGDISLEKDNNTYIFSKTSYDDNLYEVKEIKGNNLVSSKTYEELVNDLAILIGDGVYNSSISIDLEEDQFSIILK